jgi:hypothetical protein
LNDLGRAVYTGDSVAELGLERVERLVQNGFQHRAGADFPAGETIDPPRSAGVASRSIGLQPHRRPFMMWARDPQ